MYTDYQEHIKLLNMEQRGYLLTAIMSYASEGTMPNMDGMTQMAFSFIKAQMDRDNEKYEKTVEKRREAGKLGGRPTKPKGLDEEAKKANGFSEKQGKAKKPDTDTVTDTVTDTEIHKESIGRFAPPTSQDVSEFCKEKGIDNFDVERFIDFYTSKGWMVGKNKMKDWRAAVRNWVRQDKATNPSKPPKPKQNSFTNYPQRSYDYAELEKQLLNSQ